MLVVILTWLNLAAKRRLNTSGGGEVDPDSDEWHPQSKWMLSKGHMLNVLRKGKSSMQGV